MVGALGTKEATDSHIIDTLAPSTHYSLRFSVHCYNTLPVTTAAEKFSLPLLSYLRREEKNQCNTMTERYSSGLALIFSH